MAVQTGSPFGAARGGHVGIPDSLAQLIDEGVVDEVLGRIMSGKEAEVFAVMRHGQVCAAKVYKPRNQRSFKNHAAYTEGRTFKDSRTRRAVQARSRFGLQQVEQSWKDMEHHALQIAFHAGVRVPEPYLLYDDTLLMQLVVDDEGMPAPRLSDLTLTAQQANAIHEDLFEQVKRLLSCHRIHGDLSAYNVLMGSAGPTIIDMPQVIDSAANLQAEPFLVRDVRNFTEYLARFDPSLMAMALAGKSMWRHYRAGTLDRARRDEAEAMVPRRHQAPQQRPRGPETARKPLGDGREEVVFNQARERGRRFSRDTRAQAQSSGHARHHHPVQGGAAPQGHGAVQQPKPPVVPTPPGQQPSKRRRRRRKGPGGPPPVKA